MSDAPLDERPPFARAWPSDPDLDRLIVAFQRGDYAEVRARAPRLAKEASDPAVRTAALELRRRIDPDPLSALLVVVAVGLLAVLAWHYLGHRPDDPNPSRPRPVAPPPARS